LYIGPTLQIAFLLKQKHKFQLHHTKKVSAYVVAIRSTARGRGGTAGGAADGRET